MAPLMRIRHWLVVPLLAAGGACGGAPSGGQSDEGPPQDSLAATIRAIRVGEDPAVPAGAVAAAARIPPGHLGDELHDAMARALVLSVATDDSVLRELGAMLEDALAPHWSEEDLVATLRRIPSETYGATTRQRIAARLASRIEAGRAGEDLLAAMAGAFASIALDQYLMHGIRDELAAAWAKHHSAKQLAGFIRSIATGAEGPEQAAAAHVVLCSRFDYFRPCFRDPPAWMDSTGVTDPGLRTALVEALAYKNEVGKRRARERNRLEAIGDRAALDSLRRSQYGQYGRAWGIYSMHRALAWAVSGMKDPATIGLLAEAGVDGVSLETFGYAAVSPILSALADAAADRDHVARLLSQLTWIARKHELTPESRGAVAAAVQGFLTGETLRAMQIADPWGDVLSAAVSLAVALDDPAVLATVSAIAADPLEIVRAGVEAGNVGRLASEVRRKVGWAPPARSQAEIAAELRTVPRSPRETLSQIEAATLAAQIPPGDLSDTVRSAMIEAWDYARRAGDSNDWYRVESALESRLRAGFTQATAAEAIRAIPTGRYGPIQALAVRSAFRLRGDAGEDLRLAMIAALEHLNSVEVDVWARPSPPVLSLYESLARALGDEPRALPALARAGWGLACASELLETLPVASAREILAAITAPGAPPRRVQAGLHDLAVLLVGNNRLRNIPDDLVAEIAAVAGGYLDGTALEASPVGTPALRFWIVRSAIYLAAAADAPELVTLVERLAADPAAVSALGVTDPEDTGFIRDYARNLLAERPILMRGDC